MIRKINLIFQRLRDHPNRSAERLGVDTPRRPTPDPRERLLARGADALTTRDLLHLVVARPTDGLLARYGTLRRLARASPAELVREPGVGRATAVRLSAALALARRLHGERLPLGRRLHQSREIFEAFHARMRDLRKERFLAVMLDAKNRVLREEQVSEGTLTASLVHPREVFGPAIREAAAGLVLVHNHPSGDPEPSPEDVEVTRRLCAVGELVGIRVLDHVVIGDARYVSFLERGLIAP